MVYIIAEMIKSRTEIALARLLSRCQEMAASSEDLSAEWRLPKFISSCEEMLSSLPRPPDCGAPPPDTITEFQNKIKFLRSVLPPPPEPEEELTDQRLPAPASVPMPLPQGSGLARDTVSKQIYQKMAERQNMSARDQLLSSASSQVDGVKGLSLDKILSDQREQQEKIAEEMLLLAQDLKEQSTLAGSIIRKDTTRLEQSSAQADSNLEKLNIETKRVSEFSERGNCRCWILLMMVIVIFNFIGMVLMMRLFSKKTILPSVEPPETITQSQSRYVEEL